MDLRGTLKIVSREGSQFIQEEPEGLFTAAVYQTGDPQSEEEVLVGTLVIFANGETKLVEHRSQD